MEKTNKKSRKVPKIKHPKKAMSAYAAFVKEFYNKIMQAIKINETQNSKPRHMQVMKKLREKWKNMKSEDKRKYTILAEQDKKRYYKECDKTINKIIVNALK